MLNTPPAPSDNAPYDGGVNVHVDALRTGRLKRRIATLRDRSQTAAQRALAGAFLAAELSSSQTVDDGPVSKPDASQRMFEYGVFHERALPWDGRGPRSGTITYVASDRVEQYVGQQVWIAYAGGELNDFTPELGDQVRVVRRADRVEAERIAANRLEGGAADREARSGMTLFFACELDPSETQSTAQAVAERYASTASAVENGFVLESKGAARLEVRPLEPASSSAASHAAHVLQLPPAGAVRLEVAVRSNRADAALEAERALMLSAALLTADQQAVGVDDTGAVFAAEDLYVLGSENQTRADSFAFVAAAASSIWPAAPGVRSPSEGACDELIVFWDSQWRADFALSFLRRALDELAEGAERSGDPVVPVEGEICGDDERGESGTFQPLLRLFYETVAIEAAFVAVSAQAGELAAPLGARADVEALLGRPVRSALVFSLRPRGEDAESETFGLDLRRADAFVTGLAAICARRADCIASDAAATLYDVDELLALALHRRGKASSWRARVAQALGEARD
ncbi:MAG: hypothetical protein ACLPYS_16490 [Vulcanimicrobiaceae bacterium]